MSKTAMQKLLDWHRTSMRSYSETNKMIETMLKEEKEQIKDTYADGIMDAFDDEIKDKEDYYKETYQNK